MKNMTSFMVLRGPYIVYCNLNFVTHVFLLSITEHSGNLVLYK